MNEKFDELAKGLAQSVTRRRLAARKHTTIVTAVIILATLASHPAAAQQFSSWSAPVNLGPSINTEFSEFHPAISADGLTLFFSSDYPGGFGENDLWVTHRAYRNTDWGPAQNLGPSFNTAGGEYGPALSPDGHWLFFCSSGLAGAKGNNLNIFTAFREDTSDNFGWAQPFNLGKGVNGDHHNCDPTVFVDPETGVTTNPARAIGIFTPAPCNRTGHSGTPSSLLRSAADIVTRIRLSAAMDWRSSSRRIVPVRLVELTSGFPLGRRRMTPGQRR